MAPAADPTDAVLFAGVSLVLGITCRHLLRGTRVPYTIALLVLGIALGWLGLSQIFPSMKGKFRFSFL